MINQRWSFNLFEGTFFTHRDIGHNKAGHSCENGNPKKYWTLPYQVRGRLRQARNEKLHKIYVFIYMCLGFALTALSGFATTSTDLSKDPPGVGAEMKQAESTATVITVAAPVNNPPVAAPGFCDDAQEHFGGHQCVGQ